MSISSRVTMNTTAATAGRVVGSLLAIVSIGLITRALGREGFGEYATVLAYLSIFSILADLGLYTLMSREIARPPRERSKPGASDRYVVSNFFTLRLVVATALLLAAALLVFLFPYPDTVKIGVLFTTAAYLFLSLSQVLMGVFQKYLAVYKTSIAEVAARAAQLALVWFFFTQELGLFAFLGAVVAGSAVIFGINLYFARRLVPFSLALDWPYWKRTIITALPIAASLVFTLLYFKIDTIMLSLMKSSEEVGLYNAAYKVLEALIFFPAMFVGLMMPFLSRYAASDMRQFRVVFHRASRVLFLVGTPMMIGGILLASSTINVIGGAEFAPAFVALQILFIAVGAVFFGNLGGNSIVALNLQKRGMLVYFLGMIVNIVANALLIPRYSYIGASWTTVGTELLVTVLLFGIIWRHTGTLPRVERIVRTLPAIVVTAIVVGALAYPFSQPLPLPVFVGVFLLGWSVYGALLFVFRAITPREARDLLSFIR